MGTDNDDNGTAFDAAVEADAAITAILTDLAGTNHKDPMPLRDAHG
ncbi:MAG: hypothetical protein JWQ95_5275 [Sphaerisporangium sp.]|jgi:hypothetical protein|nr:hypothetical protein [Sphaerisporangium sp.]